MKNFTKLLFFVMLFMSTFIVISSSNWLSMWMGLEINLLSFIPIMFNKKKKSESLMIYFMVQSMASIILLISILWNNLLMISNFMSKDFISYMMIISLMMKIGSAPLHFWMPEIMMSLSWWNCLILMTWQKIAPIFMISKIKMNNLVMMFIVASVVVGAVGGLNQNSIKKILAFSSINHLGWLMSCIYMNNKIWMKYMLIYFSLLAMITLMMNMYNMNFISQISMTPTSFLFKINFMVTMMSLGGMPPLMGFLPKLIIIQDLMMKNIMIMLIMIMMSMITLFYYMKIMINMIMNFYTMNKWMLKNMKSEKFQNMIMLMNFLMPLLSLTLI